jgi:hypothetical protein
MNIFTAAFAALVAATGLAFAAPARAADSYELDTVAFETAPGVVADTELDLYAPPSLAAPARIVVYAPAGYGAALGQPAGTQIGTIDGGALAIAGTARDLSGTIVTDDPAKHTADACAPGTHAGVWILNVTAAGITAPLPMYVDTTSGAETARGAYRFVICLQSPYVDASAGGAPLGARLLEADLDFPQIFTNPAMANLYVWRAYVTPYAVGTSTPNAAGTVEVRSDVALPYRLTLKGARDKKNGTVAIITGTVSAVGLGVVGAPVRFLVGTSRDVAKMKLTGRATTVKGGKFTLRLKAKTTIYVTAFVPVLPFDCDPKLLTDAPAGCAIETLSPVFAAGVIKIVVSKKKK